MTEYEINEAFVIVRRGELYGPFMSQMDACDAAIHRYGNEADWDVRKLNPTMALTATVMPAPVKKRPPSVPLKRPPPPA